MQKLISKYGLAAHLALVAVAPLFLSSAAVLYLTLLGAVWLVMEPSRIGDETLHEARGRVALAIFHDPVFWVLLALSLGALIAVVNTGVGAAYQVETASWVIAPAAFPLLPSSVEGVALPLLSTFLAALVVTEGARHALGRAARSAFTLVASCLSGIGALVWGVLAKEGVARALALTACPVSDPVFMGGAFGIFLSVAVIALASAFEFGWFKVIPLAIVAVTGNAFGLFMFAPSPFVVLYASIAFLLLVYAILYLHFQGGRHYEAGVFVLVVFAVAAAALAVIGLLPANLAGARAEEITTGAFVPANYAETRTVLSDVAARAWKERPWLGFGEGSFDLCLQFYATDDDWRVLTPLQKAVPNGYWTILLEGGVIRAFLLAALFALLLVSYVVRLAKGVRRALPHPLSWIGLLAFLAVVAETLVDSSISLPGLFVALVAVFSLSAMAFPKEMKSHV